MAATPAPRADLKLTTWLKSPILWAMIALNLFFVFPYHFDYDAGMFLKALTSVNESTLFNVNVTIQMIAISSPLLAFIIMAWLKSSLKLMAICALMTSLSTLCLALATLGGSWPQFLALTVLAIPRSCAQMATVFFFLIILELKIPKNWWAPTIGFVEAVSSLPTFNFLSAVNGELLDNFGNRGNQLIFLVQLLVGLVSLALCLYLQRRGKIIKAETPQAA